MTHVNLDTQPEVVRQFVLTLSASGEGAVLESAGRPVACVVPPPKSATDASVLDGEWTDEKNRRRAALLDRKYDGGLSPTEEAELALLQEAMHRTIDQVAPLHILHSAASDTRDGSHSQALAKFLWFHHNALRHDRAFSAVRLSFALSYWMELASVYPPARAAFIRTRDETEAAFRSEPSSFELFHELAALNRYLGDGPRTADLFVSTARADHAAAERLYRVAEPFLTAVGRYDACGPFLDPPKRMRLAADAYKMMSRMEEARPADERAPPPLARSFYMHDVATLVGLLFLNHRVEEADEASAQALAVLDDEEFRALLAAAMSGHLPPPQFG